MVRANPLSTGLQYQYRANDITGVANGVGVTNWVPTVGSGTLTQATSTNRPLLTTGAVNGKAALDWGSAANTRYLAGTVTSDTSPTTWVIIVSPDASISTNQHQVVHGTQEVHTEVGFWKAYAGTSVVPTQGSVGTGWQVVTVVLNGASSVIYKNGSQISSGSWGTAASGTTLNIGRHATSGRNWRGQIAEVLRYSGALTQTERAEVHSYAQDFYGITVADYVDIDAPTAPVLSASSITDNSVTLTWTAGTDNVGVTGYDLYVDGAWVDITFTPPQTSYSYGFGSPGETYNFSLRTFDAAGNNTFSNTVPVTFTGGAVTGSAGFTGSGTLTTAGKPLVSRPAALSGAGTLTTAASPKPTGNASLSGAGTLTTAGTPKPAAAAALSGAGTLAPVGTPKPTGAVALSGAGSLAAAGAPNASQPATLDGAGALTSSAAPSVAQPATLSGSGALTTTGTQSIVGTSSFAGDGSLTSTGQVVSTEASGSASFAGSGSLSLSALPRFTRPAALSGAGTLAGSGTPSIARSASLTGAGALTVATSPAIRGTADLMGTGDLRARPQRVLTPYLAHVRTGASHTAAANRFADSSPLRAGTTETAVAIGVHHTSTEARE